MRDGTPCPACGEPMSMARCWRLTCTSNGARESSEAVRGTPIYQAAKRASADRASQIKFGHPSSWGEPPDPEFMIDDDPFFGVGGDELPF